MRRSTGNRPEGRPARSRARRHALRRFLAAIIAGGAVFSLAHAQTSSTTPTVHAAAAHKFKAVDADNHTVLINKPGFITLVIGTNEDTQDAARAAGNVMHPFQGRHDFQLVVVVDLRGSMAAWVPSVVTAQMRSNLDQEAVELKPFYLKNGNKGNPRNNACVIPDFHGTICPQLDWPANPEDLRGILFGGDGRELKRWDKLTDFTALQNDVRAAIAALDEASLAKAAAAAKTQGTKLVQPPSPPPPLPPPDAPSKAN